MPTDTATVLFTDLVGSTEMRQRLGDDRADELRRAHDALITRAAVAHGGRVVKGLGDGFLITFSSAASGIAAAVAMQQVLEQHNRSAPDELAVRVGLSVGDVTWEGDDCFGTPVIEASRLCAACTGGRIVVSDLVRLLARQTGFEFEPLGALELKGIVEPVPASRVLWQPLAAESAADLPLPALLATVPTVGLAGRDAELEELRIAWKAAQNDGQQTVLLAGEPGIGKSRLARDIAVEAHEAGAIVLYGRCEEELGAPYQPFVEALEHYVSNASGEQLTTGLGRYAGELTRLYPALVDRVPDLPAALASDPETERYRLFEAVAAWLTAAAEPAALVLILDDIHWATRPTLLLLQHVLHAASSSRLLILGTYRDTDLDRVHPLTAVLADLRRAPSVRRLALAGLDRAGVLRLMTDAAGHDLDEDGLALASALHSETEGNPFFVTEVLRNLSESGAIQQHDGRWVTTDALHELGIPESVREVVGRRLTRLSESANATLTVAAAIGRDFDLDLLTGVQGIDEDSVIGDLEAAVAARLVEETGADRYRFAHALVRSTLYDEMSATRRARLHRRVAAYLEEQRPDDVAALAYHYGQSTAPVDAEKAVDYAIRAGDEAMQQLAHDQALQYFASALEHLDAADADDAVRRAAVMLGLGKAQRYSGDASYRATLLAAADLAHEAGLVDVEADAVLANSRGFWSAAGTPDSDRIMRIERAERCIGEGSLPARRARLLGLLATELMFAGDNDRRQACMEQAITLARAVDDEATLAAVLALAVPSRFLPWTTGAGLADARELVDLATRLADPSLQIIAGVWLYTMVMLAEDDVSTGQAALRQATLLADELGQPVLRWISASWRGLEESHRGDVDAVERSAGEALELGTGSGQPDAATWFYGQSWWVAFARDQLAAVTDLVEAEVTNNPGLPAWKAALSVNYAVTGQMAEARALLAEFVHDGRVEAPRDVLWLGTHTQLAWVAAEVGDDVAAAVLYDALLPYRSLRSHSGVFVLAPVELYLGRLARCLGRTREAVAHLAAAVSRARTEGAWFALSLSLSALAEASHAAGAAGDRNSLLDEALDAARRCPSAYAERLVERARAAIN